MVVRKKATNARKMGWEDPDRLSPAHDAIVHWLEEHQDTLIAQWFDDPRNRAPYWQAPEVVEQIAAISRQRAAALNWLRLSVEQARTRSEERAATRLKRAAQTFASNEEYRVRHPGGDHSYMGGSVEEIAAREAAEEAKELALFARSQDELHRRLVAWQAYSHVPRVEVGLVEKSEWERPIMHASGNSVIGFVDYYLSFLDAPQLTLKDDDGLRSCSSGSGEHRYWHAEQLDNRLNAEDASRKEGFSVGKRLPWWGYREVTKHLCMEVKAEIGQISEVLRQLQFYKVYERGPWAVVTPDWQHAKTLLEQGFGFIPYTPGAAPVVYRPGARIPEVPPTE